MSKELYKSSQELDTCPFCKGKARVSFKQHSFYGWNGYGQRKIKYRVQIICNKCHSRGKPIVTDWLIDPNPYCVHDVDKFTPYVEKAITAWNTREKR